MFSKSFFIISLYFNTEIVDHRKHSSSFLFFGFIVTSLCNNHLGDLVYDPPLLKREVYNLLARHFQN